MVREPWWGMHKEKKGERLRRRRTVGWSAGALGGGEGEDQRGVLLGEKYAESTVGGGKSITKCFQKVTWEGKRSSLTKGFKVFGVKGKKKKLRLMDDFQRGGKSQKKGLSGIKAETGELGEKIVIWRKGDCGRGAWG